MLTRLELLQRAAATLVAGHHHRRRRYRPRDHKTMAQVVIQPSHFQVTSPAQGTWYYAIPAPGTFVIPAQGGYPTCSNLFGGVAGLGPSLAYRYEINSYAIGFAWERSLTAASATPPAMIAELAFLLSGQVVHLNQQIPTPVGLSGGTSAYIAVGFWSMDFTNPIKVGAHQTLALRMGIQGSLPGLQDNALVGIQTDDAGADLLFPSTITYDNIRRY